MGVRITLTEYAHRHGRSVNGARSAARRGCYKTAIKMGNTWLIDEDDVLIDHRVTTGKSREKYRKIKEEYMKKKGLL